MGWVDPRTNRIVAYMKGVKPVLVAHRDRGLAWARGEFAGHDQAGGAELRPGRGRVDQYIELVDTDRGNGEPAALAIEAELFLLRRALGRM